MLTLLSLTTSIKDYIEIVHKLVESDPTKGVNNYYDFGAIITYLVLAGQQVISNIFSFQWMQNLGALPVIVPDIASSMISEISVLDGYFHNAFTFLETPISYGNQNVLLYCIEKFSIGVINSLFLFLPTSTAHIICLRRFVMQGLEAGYIAGLGTIAGNTVWIGSVIFGLRFLVIPWLSLDILRYFLGFVLLVKYMWDSYTERRVVLEDLSKWKIFLINFLLAFTEQTSIYPFLTNLSIGSDSTILESFPAQNLVEFFSIHSCYLVGIVLGSLSLLQFTCWFWENPAFNLYMWIISSFKVTTSVYYKFLNFTFLYLTMICAISSVAYFGLDYTITNPLGLVHEDRLVDQKTLLETAFLNTKASDRNTRRNRGRHGRRERWKRRVRRYRTFDASLYDQGIYDLFTIEDLNYGFDRFWYRRKIRNHRVRFRFFPGPWMRSFKKQLSRPRLDSFMGPRVEFFRILFEQVYHPEFHEFRPKKNFSSRENLILDKNIPEIENFSSKPKKLAADRSPLASVNLSLPLNNNRLISIYSDKTQKSQKNGLIKEFSALRKFVRKVNTRIKISKIQSEVFTQSGGLNVKETAKPIYSKRWKHIFSKLSRNSSTEREKQNLLSRFSNQIRMSETSSNEIKQKTERNNLENMKKRLSKKDRQILRYKTFLNMDNNLAKKSDIVNEKQLSFNQKYENQLNRTTANYKPITLLHPLKFYLQKEKSFQRKLKFYGANVFRNFGVENNSPYFRIMMKRFFYYYKPTLRWERTMHTATMRKARRKSPRTPRKLNVNKETLLMSKNEQYTNNSNNSDFAKANIFNENNTVNPKTNVLEISPSLPLMQKPTHFYSLVGKRANRYRYQIYKDVLQHWYYTPFNRFLLKLDVDSFIRRQPKTQFLTKKEEKVLHLRRFLLSEYYESLRWYTYMQHYRSMKSRIGGTKSFASRIYNQQFQGTFKKVRHLFSITPSSGKTQNILTPEENTLLKFDQPLYNEFSNRKNNSIFNDSIMHEELLTDQTLFLNQEFSKTNGLEKNAVIFDNSMKLPLDLTNQSNNILREYIKQATPIRQDLIKQLLLEKNYEELTKFLFKGQKTRGIGVVTNEHDLLKQEKEYLLTFAEKEELKYQQQQKLQKLLKTKDIQQNLWIALIKKCQNKLYDQESLKTYLSRHIEKRDRQKDRQEKQLKNRLERIKNWLVNSKVNRNLVLTKNTPKTLIPENLSQISFSSSCMDDCLDELNSSTGLTTAIQKAVKEGLYYQKSLNAVKSNIRNNRPIIDLTTEKSLLNLSSMTHENSKLTSKKLVSGNSNKLLNLKNHLKNRTKLHLEKILQAETEIKKSLKFSKDSVLQQRSFSSRLNYISSLVKRTLTPFNVLSKKLNTIVLRKSENNIPNINNFRTKDLDFWRKTENVLTKRKKTRKTMKRLKNKNMLEINSLNIQTPINSNSKQKLNFSKFVDLKNRQRQKRDLEDSLNRLETKRRVKSWNQWVKDDVKMSSTNISALTQINNIFSNILGFDNLQLNSKQFKRKRSRLRRYRRFRGRGPIKKRTLGEKLKRQFKLLKKYERTDLDDSLSESNSKKVEIFQMITKKMYDPVMKDSSKQLEETNVNVLSQGPANKVSSSKPNSEFKTREIKQRRTRHRKHRFWKKHKKQKYAQNKRKFRKRRRYTSGKIRVLNKELKHIEGNLKIKQWWWQHFLPNYQATTDAIWQIEKDQQIQQKLSKMSSSEILERNESTLVTKSNFELQIGDKDYKPLALPEALKIRNRLQNQNETSKATFINEENNQISVSDRNATNELDNVQNIVQNLLTQSKTQNSNQLNNNESKFIVGVNPIPFYAGWDETLRKFTITNRLLSRQEAGYEMNLSNKNNNYPSLEKLATNSSSKKLQFTNAPLQGMNAATTLYWQIPFTTYDPDQFFTLGMDGFSPINWNKFNFKHSIQTTKPILVKTKTIANEKSSFKNSTSNLTYNIQMKLLSDKFRFMEQNSLNNNLNGLQNSVYRRIQKRYKRVKKHPRPPVWFPSGPLNNEVLPVHYIYVFYKRYRLPRDRYIRRRLRRGKKGPSLSMKNSNTKITDFTLRRRVKTRRKYHRKRVFKQGGNISINSLNNELLLKRRKFRNFTGETELSRPISKIQSDPSLMEQGSSVFKGKQRKKSSANKQQAENLRIRQLRRRVQRQVLRPVWRYRPRAGGFTWPGDYLRLELVKAPRLQINSSISMKEESKISSKQRKIRKKKRRTIQEWQVQPKKYLLQKHNIKVLKKRLEKSQNVIKLNQRVKELNYLLNN